MSAKVSDMAQRPLLSGLLAERSALVRAYLGSSGAEAREEARPT